MMCFDKSSVFQKNTIKESIHQNSSCHFSLFCRLPTNLAYSENKRSKIIQKKIHLKSTCCSKGEEISQSVDVVEMLGNFAQAGM